MIEKEFDYYNLELTHDNKILIVTFSRPPVNAFIKECYEELSEIVNYVNVSDEITSVLLNSDQKYFSAGADVKQLKKDEGAPQSVIGDRRTKLRKSWHDLSTCRVPVVVAVNGGAVGMGAAIAACGDIIIADENAFLSIPEINIGLVGGASSLKRLIPPQKVRTLALTGKKLSVEDIYKYGGIEEVVPSKELNKVALNYAKEIADKGYKTIRKWKEAIILTENSSVSEGALIESCLSQEL